VLTDLYRPTGYIYASAVHSNAVVTYLVYAAYSTVSATFIVLTSLPNSSIVIPDLEAKYTLALDISFYRLPLRIQSPYIPFDE